MAAKVEEDEVVDRAATLVSAVVALACAVAVEDETAGENAEETICGAETIVEDWPRKADEEVVATTGGGIVCSTDVWTCGGGNSTCAAEVEEVDAEEKLRRDVVVVLVCWIVLLTSVLGNAVHLFPPSVVMKAPRGRFGLVAISSRVGVVCRVAIPVATRGRN